MDKTKMNVQREACTTQWIIGLSLIVICHASLTEPVCPERKHEVFTSGLGANITIGIQRFRRTDRATIIQDNEIIGRIHPDFKTASNIVKEWINDDAENEPTLYLTIRNVEADVSGNYALRREISFTFLLTLKCWSIYVFDMSVRYNTTSSGYIAPGTRLHNSDLPYLPGDIVKRMNVKTQWYFNGDVLGSESDGIVVQQAMNLQNLTYVITDPNNITADMNITLNVAYIDDLKLSLNNLMVVEDESIPEVTCFADCNPSCVFAWKKNKKTVSEAQTLQLGRAHFNVSGKYSCVATNTELHESKETDVHVHVYYQDADINVRPGDTFYLLTGINDVQTVECVAPHCYPACSLAWFKDGTRLQTSTTLDIQHLSSSSMSSSRTGVYTCEALHRLMNRTVSKSVHIYDHLEVTTATRELRMANYILAGFVALQTIITIGLVTYLVQQRLCPSSRDPRNDSVLKDCSTEQRTSVVKETPVQSDQETYYDLKTQTNTGICYETCDTGEQPIRDSAGEIYEIMT